MKKEYAYLGISNGHFEQLLEVIVAFLVLVSLLAPLRHKLAVENEDVEECVQQEDDIVLDGNTVQKNGLWRGVEGVGHQGRLYHDQRIVNILLVQDMPEMQRSVPWYTRREQTHL